MNYRHIYHAGHFADVFKHIMLMMALDYLKQKDKPLFALDTHAGIGLYDLKSVEAQKTGEAAAGIGRLWARDDAPEEIKKYLSLIKTFNAGNDLCFYPGSPLIMQEMLRGGDRMVVNELHPDDHITLRKNMKGDRRARIEDQDGYIAMKAHLPPHERRGLVLCDPPFEVTNEFDLMLAGLKNAYARWATGIYMFWYPVKDPAIISKYHQSLAAAGIPKITAIEFLKQKSVDKSAFNGTGLVIVNPPWTMADQARTILPWLVDVLTDGHGHYNITQITGEKLDDTARH